MAAVILILVLAVVFSVLSVFQLMGKGIWLIAGYNTLSAEEKQQYDEKKLCRASGTLMAVISLMLYPFAWLMYRIDACKMSEASILPFVIVFSAVIVAGIIAEMWYVAKKCKRR
ncbi:MAG: DUF3784 domain-containing protein [Oscillospiraceae bacterium]